ncbi:hypothetical protein ACINWC743_A0192 [Acinetobacter sp. WC-743]|nr:hypothetical protein ACINWC743_A0192 [Acinetobacter sp. WC-743]
MSTDPKCFFIKLKRWSIIIVHSVCFLCYVASHYCHLELIDA